MNIIKNISVLLIFCFLFVLSSVAQTKESFSYIYIQSDKELPFYVKYEDEMLPRYGKNYSIISELAPGPANLQILFQQHTLPPIKFVVQVPENGFRGFLLTRKGDQFSLYDIHQKFYLAAGNIATDDQLPIFNKSQRIPEPPKAARQPEVPKPAPVTIPAEQPRPPKQEKVKEKEQEKPKKETTAVDPIPTPPSTVVSTPKPQPPVSKPPVTIQTAPATPETNTSTTKKDPQFIDNIALENDRTAAPGGTISKPARNRIVVGNSDCPEPLSEEAFVDLERRVSDKFGDDRLKYVLGRMNDCFTTAQMRTLARAMNSDAERYTLLKKGYSRVTDQSVFHILEREFTEPEWKEYFRALLKK